MILIGKYRASYLYLLKDGTLAWSNDQGKVTIRSLGFKLEVFFNVYMNDLDMFEWEKIVQ